MLKKTLFTLTILILAALLALPQSAAQAAVALPGYPWRDHAAPFTFLFGNHIDMHQQSHTTGRGLTGFLYIHFTGETINGIPVAEHSDCSADPSGCVVGWVITGVKAQGTVVSKDAMGMPLICTTPDARRYPKFSHFHWLGAPAEDMDLVVGQTYSGYLLQLVATQTFYFTHHGMTTLVRPGIDTVSHANVMSCS